MKPAAIIVMLGVVVAVAGAASTGCTDKTAPQSAPAASIAEEAARKQRVAVLDAEIAAAERVAPGWKAWHEAAAKFEPRACPGGTLCLVSEKGAEQDVWQTSPSLEDPVSPGPLAALEDLGRQLRAHGIDLLVLPIPDKSVLHPDLIAPVPPEGAGVRPDVHLLRFYRELERRGVEVLDMYDAFASAKDVDIVDDKGAHRPDRVYREADIHFASRGFALAADLIAARVRLYPWFAKVAEEKGRILYTESTAWVEDTGFFGEPIGKYTERHMIRRIVPVGGTLAEPFIGDPRSPIVLIGDSFAEYESWAQRRSGLADHLLRALGLRVDLRAAPGGAAHATRVALDVTRHGLPGVRLVVYELGAGSLRPTSEWTNIDFFASSSPDARSPDAGPPGARSPDGGAPDAADPGAF